MTNTTYHYELLWNLGPLNIRYQHKEAFWTEYKNIYRANMYNFFSLYITNYRF